MIKLTEKRLQWFSERFPTSAVSLGYLDGVKSWRKYGKNNDIDIATVPETIWADSGLYPFQSSIYTAEVLSTDANDTSAGTGARTVRLFGLNTNFLEVTEDVIMDGATPVATTRTDWSRLDRGYVLTAGSGEVNAGDITVRLASAGATQAVILTGQGQTQQAAMTLPGNYNATIMAWSIHMMTTGVTTEMEFGLFTRDGNLTDAAWRLRSHIGVKSSGTTSFMDAPIVSPLPIGPKTDIDVRLIANDSNNVRVASIFEVIGLSTTLTTPPAIP